MRRLLAIVLLSALVFTGTELHQFARLPHLVHHFLDHQEEDPGIGLFKFLTSHYFNGQVHDEDFGQDEQLPFRSHDTHLNFSSAQDLFHALPEAVVVHHVVITIDRPHPVASLALGARADVWQPPKRA